MEGREEIHTLFPRTAKRSTLTFTVIGVSEELNLFRSISRRAHATSPTRNHAIGTGQFNLFAPRVLLRPLRHAGHVPRMRYNGRCLTGRRGGRAGGDVMMPAG